MKEAQGRDFYKEFDFIAARSGGAGGQNVNKVSTKIALRFHVDSSELLTSEEKALVHQKLKKNINNEGYLQLVCQEERSQLKNKTLCIKKFYDLLGKSLRKPKRRKSSMPTQASIAKRLKSKNITAQKKAARKKKFEDDV